MQKPYAVRYEANGVQGIQGTFMSVEEAERAKAACERWFGNVQPKPKVWIENREEPCKENPSPTATAKPATTSKAGK